MAAVDIVNEALSHLGIGKPIADLANDIRAEALHARTHIDRARVMFLLDNVWRFSEHVAALSPAASNPMPDRWAYAYQRPADALKILDVWPATGLATPPYTIRSDEETSGYPYLGNRFDIKGSTIYTHLDDARAHYVRDIPDYETWPAAIQSVFSAYLAAVLAFPLTRDMKMRQDAFTLYNTLRTPVVMSDANEAPNERSFIPESVAARTEY